MEFYNQDYKKFDTKGKELLTTYLIKQGYTVSLPKEDYGVDLHALKNNKIHNFDIEMKKHISITDVESYPYSTVSFLSRKKKYGIFWYVIISIENSGVIIVHSSTIYRDEYKENFYIDNLYRKGDDSFYRVPKELCVFISPEKFLE